jgi:hypothetical protein
MCVLQRSLGDKALIPLSFESFMLDDAVACTIVRVDHLVCDASLSSPMRLAKSSGVWTWP